MISRLIERPMIERAVRRALGMMDMTGRVRVTVSDGELCIFTPTGDWSEDVSALLLHIEAEISHDGLLVPPTITWIEGGVESSTERAIVREKRKHERAALVLPRASRDRQVREWLDEVEEERQAGGDPSQVARSHCRSRYLICLAITAHRARFRRAFRRAG